MIENGRRGAILGQHKSLVKVRVHPVDILGCPRPVSNLCTGGMEGQVISVGEGEFVGFRRGERHNFGIFGSEDRLMGVDLVLVCNVLNEAGSGIASGEKNMHRRFQVQVEGVKQLMDVAMHCHNVF